MCNHCDCRSHYEAQVWLWQHKVLLGVLGMLLFVGLLVSGNGM